MAEEPEFNTNGTKISYEMKSYEYTLQYLSKQLKLGVTKKGSNFFFMLLTFLEPVLTSQHFVSGCLGMDGFVLLIKFCSSSLFLAILGLGHD